MLHARYSTCSSWGVRERRSGHRDRRLGGDGPGSFGRWALADAKPGRDEAGGESPTLPGDSPRRDQHRSIPAGGQCAPEARRRSGDQCPEPAGSDETRIARAPWADGRASVISCLRSPRWPGRTGHRKRRRSAPLCLVRRIEPTKRSTIGTGGYRTVQLGLHLPYSRAQERGSTGWSANGAPAMIARRGEHLEAVFLIEVVDGAITHFYAVRNRTSWPQSRHRASITRYVEDGPRRQRR